MQARTEKKAQAVLIDLLVGMTLFLLIAAAGLTILDNQINAISEQQQLLEQQKATETALNQLVKSAGETTIGTTNWESASIDNVKFLGLAVTDRVIFQEKINKFKEYANSEYEKTKSKLLIPGDFYFRLIVPGTGDNGTTMTGCPDETGACEAGKTEEYLTTTEGKKIDTVLKARRIVAFNGGSAIAEIIVFRTR